MTTTPTPPVAPGADPAATTALEGRLVRLEPLSLDHVDALVTATAERRHFGYSPVPADEPTMRRYVSLALAGRDEGHMLPFATIRLQDPAVGGAERPVGCTRFCRIERWDWPPGTAHHGRATPDVCEIGYTWLAFDALRTGVNVEAKLLMLRYAFDGWGVHRVSWRTDARNERSRRGIEGLGARFEGVQRAERPAVDGGIRDSALYSMTADEWPAAAAALEQRLARHR